MKRPFTILLLPLIAGILFTYYFTIDIRLVLLIMSIAIFLFTYNLIRKRASFKLLLFIIFILAILLSKNQENSNLNKYYGRRVEGLALVDELVGKEEDRSTYIVRLRRLDQEEVNDKIVLNIRGGKELEPGDRIGFNGSLEKPPLNSNPKLYNYRLNLKADKIHARMTIRDYSIRSIVRKEKPLAYRLKTSFSQKIEDLYDKYLGGEEASLIKSIILGRSFYLQEDRISLYRELGLAHLLAVSGLHIGIISGFFLFIFSRLGIRRGWNISLTLIILWFYAYMIGFPKSVLRANIMISILLYSQIVHQPYDSINSLSCAMFILLLINPYYLFNIGFQLSFLASFSIIVFSPRIKDLFYPRDNYIISSLSSILGVQLGLIPIQLYYFNSFNLVSILANLIFIPLLSLALVLAFIMLILAYVFSWGNILLGPILNLLLSFQISSLARIARIFPNISVFSPDFISIVGYYILVLVILRIIDISVFKEDIARFFTISLVLVLFFNCYSLLLDRKVEVHFIDVGQGDALLIRSQGKDYLVDSGGNIFGDFDIGERITLPYLEKLGVRRLDGVFISHFHEDHYKGFFPLLENLRIDRVFGPYTPKDSEIYRAIVERGIPYRELRAGDRLRLAKGLSLLNIWPDKGDLSSYSENNRSLVSILSNSTTRILLTGDMEREVEEILTSQYSLPIDIIKVPHHGSNTSSSQVLLDNIQADVGIISVGRNNIYGHPDREVLDRYREGDSSIYRTDQSGLIKLVLDRKGYRIKPYLKNGERPSLDLKILIYDYIFILSFYLIYCMLVYMLLKITYSWSDDRLELQRFY